MQLLFRRGGGQRITTTKTERLDLARVADFLAVYARLSGDESVGELANGVIGLARKLESDANGLSGAADGTVSDGVDTRAAERDVSK